MADFGDLDGETDDGAGQDGLTAGQDRAIRGGLLSPRAFPPIWQGGSAAEGNGPAIARPPPIFGGSIDHDVHAEVLRDILDAQARLAPAERPSDPASWNDGWLNPPAPLITGPLDTDTRAEVLRDIQNTHAQLPPASPRSGYSSVARSRSAASSTPITYQLLYNDSGAGQIPSLFSTSAGPAQLPKFTANHGVQLNTNGPALIQRNGQQFTWVETPTGTRLLPYATMSASTGLSGLSSGDRLGLLFGNPVSAIASTVTGLAGARPPTQDAILAVGSAVETPLYAAGSIGLSTSVRATKGAVPEVTQLGGAHSDVRGLAGYEAHHTPADSISPLSRKEGPSIAMLPEDHQLTASWGNWPAARAYRQAQANLIAQGNFQDAQQMDVADIKSRFGNKYDVAIQQMLNYSRSKGYRQ